MCHLLSLLVLQEGQIRHVSAPSSLLYALGFCNFSTAFYVHFRNSRAGKINLRDGKSLCFPPSKYINHWYDIYSLFFPRIHVIRRMVLTSWQRMIRCSTPWPLTVRQRWRNGRPYWPGPSPQRWMTQMAKVRIDGKKLMVVADISRPAAQMECSQFVICIH